MRKKRLDLERFDKLANSNVGFVKNKQTIFTNLDNFLVVFLLIEGKIKLYLEKFDKLANSSIEFVKNKLTLFANLVKSFDKFCLLMGILAW